MKNFLGIVLMGLTACAGKPVYETQLAERRPPAVLLEPSEQPVFTGKTNADLAEYVLRLEQVLQECNAKLVCIGQE